MVSKKEDSIIVDPGKVWSRAIKKALREVGDLRVPFEEMKESWFKSNLSIAPRTRKGPGKYIDLNPKYKKQKKRKWKFVYPILRASGLLMDSITEPGHPNSIAAISKRFMILGTNVKNKKGFPYPIKHQTGTPVMPRRPFIFIGVEQVKEAKAEIYQTRLKLWIKTLETYVADTMRMKQKR